MEKLEPVSQLLDAEQASDRLTAIVSNRAKTCKAATLSAWIALLTGLIVITHAVIALLDSLFENEKFWSHTEQLISNCVDKEEKM